MAKELTVQTLERGNGPKIGAGSVVVMHYTGRFEDGNRFASTRDMRTPFDFTVGADEVIPGLDRGLVGSLGGDRLRLIVPPELAYGDAGVPGIVPPGATLIFDVEILSVN